MQLAAWHLAMHFTLDAAIRSGASTTPTTVITGILIILAEVVTLSVYRAWEEWMNVILGMWLVICPWALDIRSLAIRANLIVVGLLVLALAIYELWEARRQSSNQT